MGSFGTHFVTRCREERSGYTFADQFDADVPTGFTYEEFLTSDVASNGLFVAAVTLLF